MPFSTLFKSVFKKPVQRGVEMTASDKRIIEQYAAGDQSLKQDAIAVHRRNTPLIGVRGNDHQCYMAEIDTSSPDLGLRQKYREKILR